MKQLCLAVKEYLHLLRIQERPEYFVRDYGLFVKEKYFLIRNIPDLTFEILTLQSI